MAVMKVAIRWFGRFLLLGILIAQAAVFSHYASFYLDDKNLYALVLLALPAILVYVTLMAVVKRQLNWQWLVWLFYVIFLLVPMVFLLFRIDFTKKLDKNDFFGPNFLKITICGAPAIAVFLLTTAKDSQKYEGAVAQLCGSIALDSFDELELLEMLLHQTVNQPITQSFNQTVNESMHLIVNETVNQTFNQTVNQLCNQSLHFSSDIEASIIAFVCISFFLTAMEMGENKFEEDGMKLRGDSCFYILRLVFQMLLVNIPLLTIRLVVWTKYGHDASIFIAKNAIIIVTSAMEVIRVIIEKIC